MNLSREHVRLLAEQERRMDSGAQPYVIFENQRMAVIPKAMDELGLQHGQTVSFAILGEILRFQLAWCAELEEQKFREQNS